MFQSLEMFRTAHALAQHAGRGQAATAMNIANADTPEYRAQRVAPFTDSRSAPPVAMRMTRQGHMPGYGMTLARGLATAESEASPNGNSVSIEDEMMRSVEMQRAHDRALAIYRHSLGVLRLSLGRAR